MTTPMHAPTHAPTHASCHCNACSAPLPAPLYESADNASITTMNKVIAGRTRVFFCNACGHLQTSELPDLARYYAEEYEINLASDEDDQLYKVVDGTPVYRAQHQAATVLAKLPLRAGQRVLDYGCAKAPTLARIAAAVPGLVPMTFDVTDKYVGFWSRFVAPENQAVGRPSPAWRGSLDVVLSFYALEHVSDLQAALTAVRDLLRPGGTFYFIVPDVYANIADFVVADHINHFSPTSLRTLLERNGFAVQDIDTGAHDAAHVVVARKLAAIAPASPLAAAQASVTTLRERCISMGAFWTDAAGRVRAFEASRPPGETLAVYGAGFYGNFVAASLAHPGSIACFIDQNPHLQGREIMGRPVLAPADLPAGLRAVVVGLNPRAARPIIAGIEAWKARDLELFFL